MTCSSAKPPPAAREAAARARRAPSALARAAAAPIPRRAATPPAAARPTARSAADAAPTEVFIRFRLASHATPSPLDGSRASFLPHDRLESARRASDADCALALRAWPGARSGRCPAAGFALRPAARRRARARSPPQRRLAHRVPLTLASRSPHSRPARDEPPPRERARRIRPVLHIAPIAPAHAHRARRARRSLPPAIRTRHHSTTRSSTTARTPRADQAAPRATARSAYEPTLPASVTVPSLTVTSI